MCEKWRDLAYLQKEMDRFDKLERQIKRGIMLVFFLLLAFWAMV